MLSFARPDASANSAIYGLNFKSRCIAAQLADASSTRFFIGTASLKDENEVRPSALSSRARSHAVAHMYAHIAPYDGRRYT